MKDDWSLPEECSLFAFRTGICTLFVVKHEATFYAARFVRRRRPTSPLLADGSRWHCIGSRHIRSSHSFADSTARSLSVLCSHLCAPLLKALLVRFTWLFSKLLLRLTLFLTGHRCCRRYLLPPQATACRSRTREYPSAHPCSRRYLLLRDRPVCAAGWWRCPFFPDPPLASLIATSPSAHWLPSADARSAHVDLVLP